MRESLPVYSMTAVFFSLPWCCIVPAVLSSVSLTISVTARLWTANFSWFLLPLSGIFLGRAFWLLYGRRQGAPWTRWLTWISAVLAVSLWSYRLWPWM